MFASPRRRAALEATIWFVVVLVVELVLLSSPLAAVIIAAFTWALVFAVRLRRELTLRD